MNVNIWNLSHRKNTMNIWEKKEAHRKHLHKLKHARSSIDINNSAYTISMIRPNDCCSKIRN